MNLKGLAHVLSKEYGLTQTFSNQVLKTIFKTIIDELKQNRKVRLRNFGTFQAKKSHGNLRAKFDDSKNFFKNPF